MQIIVSESNRAITANHVVTESLNSESTSLKPGLMQNNKYIKRSIQNQSTKAANMHTCSSEAGLQESKPTMLYFE